MCKRPVYRFIIFILLRERLRTRARKTDEAFVWFYVKKMKKKVNSDVVMCYWKMEIDEFQIAIAILRVSHQYFWVIFNFIKASVRWLEKKTENIHRNGPKNPCDAYSVFFGNLNTIKQSNLMNGHTVSKTLLFNLLISKFRVGKLKNHN